MKCAITPNTRTKRWFKQLRCAALKLLCCYYMTPSHTHTRMYALTHTLIRQTPDGKGKSLNNTAFIAVCVSVTACVLQVYLAEFGSIPPLPEHTPTPCICL